MKQTAVQWLVEQITYATSEGVVITYHKDITQLVEQALEMEKEQMHKCASFWRGKENEIEKPIFEEYYKETYEAQND
jgi:hypothetical protein